MNHRKIHSQGYIPFAWEEKPGISKFNHQKSSSDMGVGLTDLKTVSGNVNSSDEKSSIAPPPPSCTRVQPPRNSYSRKSLRWQDDPFLAALKACTRSVSTHRGYEELRQKKDMVSKEKSSSKSKVFSCKQSCSVENDNLVKVSKLPPIPKERYNPKSFVRN